MSSNLIPLPVVKVLDPRVNLNNERIYGILKGGTESTYQVYPSTSYNDSQVQITFNPPSQRTIVNRKVYYLSSYLLTFTGIPPMGQQVLQPNFDSPRAYPVASVTNTFQVTLGNDQVSTNLNQYWSGLSRYHNWVKQREYDYSLTPSMLDQYQNYSDWLDPWRGGGARNALGSYGITNEEGGRGGFVGLTITSNPVQAGAGSLTATATLVVMEPVYMSPFLFDGPERSGLIGLQNMTMTLTYASLARLWSHDPNSPVTNFVCNATTTGAPIQPAMVVNYITPDPVEPIPKALSWDYFEVVSYPTTLSAPIAQSASMLALTTQIQNMNSVQLKTIPRRMYIYARRRDADLSVSTTDTFAGINNISITFDNRVGLLSTATQQDLYEMSVKNGLNMPWSSFQRYVGSVICVDMGVDLGLPSNYAPGLVGNYQVSVQISLYNPPAMENISPALPANSVTYQMMLVIVNEGTISCMNGSFQHQVGVFTQEDILNSHVMPAYTYKRSNDIFGGNFFDTIRDIGRSVVRGAESVGRVLAPIARPLLSKGLDIAQSYLPGPAQLVAKAARSYAGVGEGGVLFGGRRAPRSALRKRLQRM